jgi:hypothetical protein
MKQLLLLLFFSFAASGAAQDVLPGFTPSMGGFFLQEEQIVTYDTVYYVTDIIWAEENGNLIVNSRQYSFGNGASGGNNFGMPIWEDMVAIGMVLNAENADVSATVGYTIDAALEPPPRQIVATGNTTVYYFPTGHQLTQGQLLSFQTTAEVGNWADVRVGLIVKKKVKFEQP